MAVLNQYVDAKISGNTTTKLMSTLNAQGAQCFELAQTFEVAAADDDGSIYRVFKNLEPNLIPLSILVYNDAMTGSTSWNVGLYRPDLGTVISANYFASALDLSSAHIFGAGLSGLAAMNIDAINKRIFEHAGHTIQQRLEAYDLCLTAATVGSAAGTVTVHARFAQG